MVMTKEQVSEIGSTVAKTLKDDLGKHITEILPDALRHHGIDPVALKGRRLPMTGESDGDNPITAAPVPGWEPDYRGMLLKAARTSNPDGWTRMADYLRAIHPVNQGKWDSRLKASSESDGGAGGFLVPTQFVAQLLMVALEMAIIRPRAFVFPMAGEHAKIPAIRDTSHATTVFGGVQAYWLAETGAVTETSPTFRQVGFTAKKLTGYTSITSELLADSAIPLEAVLQRMFGEAVAFYEDLAFIEGTGAGQPLGILNAGALISVAKETGQAATTIVAENLDKMYSRMLPASLSRAVWIAHIDTFPQIAALSRAVGTGGSSIFVGNIAGAPPVSIYGRPIIYTEKAKTLGTLGDIYFADLSYYVIAQRMEMTMAASPHVLFTTDQWVYRFIERLDGQPWIDSALTPRNGTNTLSPFVGLAARA